MSDDETNLIYKMDEIVKISNAHDILDIDGMIGLLRNATKLEANN